MKNGEFVHGRGAYIRRACRCDICREAHRAYARDYHHRRADEAAEGGRRWDKYQTRATPNGLMSWIPWGEWADEAACKGSDDWAIHAFALHKRDARRFPQVVNAIKGCEACPVLEQCTAWIFAHDIDPCSHHVVAAMTPKERNAERRRRGMRVPGNPGRGDAA